MYFRKVILFDAHTHSNLYSDSLSRKKSTLPYTKVSVSNIIADVNNPISLDKERLYSIGIHPWYLSAWELNIKQLERISFSKEIVAIGECGLDYSIRTNKEIQKEVFFKQLELSEKVEKPIIIHSVRAYADILSIRKKYKVKQKWLFHAYNSSWQMAQDLLKENCYFSFGKFILSNSRKGLSLIEKIPLNHILLESDEEENVLLDIYRKVSTIRKIDLEELVSIQKDNFEDFYNVNLEI